MKKILIVDDENLILFSLSSTFREQGTEVITAATGEAAMKAVAEHRFDACILDINLPDMNGLDIMQKIRIKSPETRIVMMTGGEITNEATMETIRKNAHMLMGKPFDLDVVKNFVDRVLMSGKPLCHDEVKSLKDSTSFIKWLADDMRKYERRSIFHDIVCRVLPSQDAHSSTTLSGNVLDISDMGLCIQTSSPLNPGCVLSLNDNLAQCKGVVRWCKSEGDARTFRAGVQFVAAGDPLFA